MKKIFLIISILCCLYYNTNAQQKKGTAIKKSFMVIAPCNCQRSISIETSEVEEDFKIKIIQKIPIKEFYIDDSSMTFYHIYDKNFPKKFNAYINNNVYDGNLYPIQNTKGDTIGKYTIIKIKRNLFIKSDAAIYIDNKILNIIELK